LTRELGDALVAWLPDGRPRSTHRAVFLSAHPPFAPFSDPGSVGWLVCQGASFKAIADVRGHQSLQTTGIYAKLDLATLEQVALPWPGASS
jgi:integrase